MTVLFANNATSRLKIATDAVSTSIQVEAGTGAKFPSPTAGDYFYLTLEDRRTDQTEICYCTSRSGDFLTIERGKEGTTPQAFAAQATVSNRLTAETLNELAAANDLSWDSITGKPATFPPTLPIPSSGVTGLDAKQTLQDTQINLRITDAPVDTNVYVRRGAAWETLNWGDIPDAPATFPPTLPIPSSGVTGLDTKQGQQDTAISANANALTTETNDRILADQAINTALNTKAPLASPAFTGNPTAPTPAPADNDTSIATTAYVQGEISTKAPLASPAFTGNPTAPTPATADNDTSIATTAFVKAQGYIGDAPSDGQSYNRKDAAWVVDTGGGGGSFDIHTLPEKATPVLADEVALANSAGAWAMVRSTLTAIAATVMGTLGSFVAGLASKATLVDADNFLIADSAASNASKRHTWSQMKGMLNAIYQPLLTGVSNFELGSSLTGDRNNYIDFHADDTNADYSARVMRRLGVNGNLEILQAGTGPLLLVASGGVQINGMGVMTKSGDNQIANGSYIQSDLPADSVSGGNYRPSPRGGANGVGTAAGLGNVRTVSGSASAWTFTAPNDPGNFTMSVRVGNGATPVAPTMTGFQKVTGTFSTTASGWSFVYITKIGSFVSANIEAVT